MTQVEIQFLIETLCEDLVPMILSMKLTVFVDTKSKMMVLSIKQGLFMAM